MGWNKARKGGLIGLIISAVLCILSIPLSEASFYFGVLWSSIFLKTTGLDYVSMSIANPISDIFFGYLLMLFTASILLVLFCALIGFIFDREESWVKKLIIILVLLLIFTPLSINSYNVKQKDKEILSHYSGGWPPDYLTEDICDSLSVFSTAKKPSCYEDLSRTSKVSKSVCDKLKYDIDRIECYSRISQF